MIGALAFLAGASLALIFIGIVFNVLVRAVGFAGPYWIVATSEYSLLYIGTLAAPWLLREKGHVYIEVVRVLLPERGKWIFAKVAYTIGLIVSVIVVVFSIPVLETNWGEYELRAYQMFKQWLVLPVTLSFLLLAIGFFRYLFSNDSMYDDQSKGAPMEKGWG